MPVEWDDLRQQLEKLTEMLQPTHPAGSARWAAFINTAADNLRGQGANIRDTIIKLSQAFSALGDHSNDIFSTVKNLSILVSALQSSTDLMRQLNQNLASVTGLLANDPNEVANAVTAISTPSSATCEASSPTTAKRWAPRRTSWRRCRTALIDSLDDIKQILHIAPTTLQNFVNIYQPAQGALTGALGVRTTSPTRSPSCAARSRRRRGWAPSSRRSCACSTWRRSSRTASTTSRRSGRTSFVGATARPNEVTYSEDWMRPDYVPPATARPRTRRPAGTAAPTAAACRPRCVRPIPADGLPGLMVAAGGGS